MNDQQNLLLLPTEFHLAYRMHTCDRAQGRPQVLGAWESHGRATSSGRGLVRVYGASDVARASSGDASSVQWKKGVYSRGSYVQCNVC